MAAPPYRSSHSAELGTFGVPISSGSFVLPAGIVAGDFVALIVDLFAPAGGPFHVNTIAGWTQLGSTLTWTDQGGFKIASQVIYRRCDGTEGGTLAFTTTGAVMLAYADVCYQTPAFFDFGGFQLTLNTENPVCPTGTAANDETIVVLVATSEQASSVDPPSLGGFTERQDFNAVSGLGNVEISEKELGPGAINPGTVHVNNPFGGSPPAGFSQAVATIGVADTGVLPPTVLSYSPSSGGVGDVIDITGTDFGTATAVDFNGTVASFVIISPTHIHATVPIGATTGPVTVTNPAGVGTGPSFTVIPAPIITSFTPGAGPVGTEVTILGSNFTGTTAVDFNGTAAASFTVDADYTMRATVPVAATTGAIHVTTPGGTATS